MREVPEVTGIPVRPMPIYQNIDYIDTYNPEYVLILSGDHIYKMDYEVMLDYHKANNADITIAAMPVPIGGGQPFRHPDYGRV